jgi:S-adenosylmethionine:tRNA ribosyltransferase-isomerase
VVGTAEGGRRTVELTSEGDLYEILDETGRTPLPPYIKRSTEGLEPADRERYQTVYAREKGSIAAPTAGLHFTPRLLRRLRERGIEITELTLHVGYGTFQPVRTDEVEDHRMESERYSLSVETVEAVERARSRGGRVVAVGTTTVRTLEAAAAGSGRPSPGEGETDLFIYPGFRFQVVDSLLTNFHLPRSSLLFLVSAFAGTEVIRRAYGEAIRERYRFYSYGDCMLISGRRPARTE